MSKAGPFRAEGTTILVIGGGVAGITAALDLAAVGAQVHLVESGPDLGGQVAKLDKSYPTDHCAFCPLWTDIRRCRDHSRITLHCFSEVKSLERKGDTVLAVVQRQAPAIDPERCICCGRCVEVCGPGAIRPIWEHAYPPFYLLDRRTCDRCGACMAACPTGAVDLERTDRQAEISVDQVIWAAGFKEADLSAFKEFGTGSHPDIMTALEFEAWTAEAGENRGRILRRSSGRPPRNIAFVQCAGARDLRLLPHCSAVCCMHALKQAQWVKRRNPAVDCTIFYTDLRTVGRGYYEYAMRDIKGSPVRLIRGRPSLIHPLPGGNGIAVKFEDTLVQKRKIWSFDMVVLNGNLENSIRRDGSVAEAMPGLDGDGFITGPSGEASSLACGFAAGPADITEAVIQASSAAARALRAKRS
jgi:heterodisulfide reductase subunit A